MSAPRPKRGRESVAAAIAARQKVPQKDWGLRKHPKIDEINLALRRGASGMQVVEAFFQKEIREGIAKTTLKARVLRHKRTHLAKAIKRNESRRVSREADRLEKVARQAYDTTDRLSQVAADKDKWDVVAQLRAEARQDLMLLGKTTGELSGEDEPANKNGATFNLQQIIALPRSGPLFADELEPDDAHAIDIE